MDAIVAISDNWVIGNGDKLPWPKIKEDFQWFKEFTMNKQLIVGRKTAQTLPRLKGRYLNVMSRQVNFVDPTIYALPIEEGKLPEAIGQMVTVDTVPMRQDSVVIGGAEIYKLFLPFCQSIYVTHVNGDYGGNIEFPYSWNQVTRMFPKSDWFRTLPGGHEVFKYSR